ncbi:phage tail protein [Xenophilus sp. AP218F]|nr:phage tail protein [Xenophilus sp. AP218F]
MAKPYKTPDVYVTEVSTLPPSVVQVATAVPAFIGNVAKVLDDGGNAIAPPVFPVIRRITSIAEYEQYFGGPALLTGTLTCEVTQKNNQIITASISFEEMAETGLDDKKNPVFSKGTSAAKVNTLYYALQLFFANGGGVAYVAAIGVTGGGLAENVAQTTPVDALKAALIELEKADEVTLLLAPEFATAADYAVNAAQPLLAHAAKMGDRFALVDAPSTIKPNDVKALTSWRGTIAGTVDTLKYGAAYYPFLNTPLQAQPDTGKIVVAGTLKKITVDENGKEQTASSTMPETTLAALLKKYTGSQLEAQTLALLAQQTLTLPPSAAIAGVYAQTDAARGVWKAPANVPLAAVNGPAVIVTAEQQGEFNVDATAGKSINVIRAFTGQGSLVWGARTLAGNSNEWRYINVRRLFNMVEESVKKATAFAMFEPNTPMTWLKVKSMIDSYLTGLWKQGALFGDTAEQAFFVTVGLGTTMTEDDINNGYMNIKIGLAAVRPAEFIELAFSHKSIGA